MIKPDTNEPCNQAHCRDIEIEDNVGNGTTLAINIAKNKGFDSNVKECKSKHPLGVYRKSESKDDYQLEAHHLICSESMKHSDWMKICNSFGYDINCKENGVFLLSFLEIACANKIPLHKGNHKATMGYGANKSVKELIDPYKENAGNYCSHPEDFKKDLDAISKKIFKFVKKFRWRITADDFHYKDGVHIGCLDYCKTLESKKKVLADSHKLKESKKNGGLKGLFFDAISKLERGCPTNRNHSDLDCKDRPHNYWSYACYREMPKEEELGLQTD